MPGIFWVEKPLYYGDFDETAEMHFKASKKKWLNKGGN